LGSSRGLAALRLCAALAFGASLPQAVRADHEAPLDMFGGTGLVAAPSARMPPAGAIAAGVARSPAGERAFLSVVPADGLALTLRGAPREPGPGRGPGGAGHAADVEVTLARQGPGRPGVAVGTLRALGDDARDGHYLVLGRRLGAFDLTAGFGTGDLAGGRGLRLPGTEAEIAPFGGLETEPWPGGPVLRADWSPGEGLALGAAWRPLPWLDLGVGAARGGVLARVALHLAPAGRRSERPPEPRPAPRPEGGRPGPGTEAAALRRMRDRLEAAGVEPAALELDGGEARAWLDRPQPGPAAAAIGRAAWLMALEAPPEASWLSVVLAPEGLPTVAATLERGALARAAEDRGSPAEVWRTAEISRPPEAPPLPPRTELALVPRIEIDPTASDRALAGRTMVDLRLSQREGWLRFLAGLRAHLGSDLPFPAATEGRPVRRDRLAYDLLAPVAVEHVLTAAVWAPAPGLLARLSTGLQEEMFAGHGGEVLWRPDGGPWAFGLSADIVWRRLPGMAVVEPGALGSGFLSLHRDDPDGTEAALHLGRYLGGDAGATAELSRELPGGARLTVRGTRTTALRGALGVSLAMPLWRPLPWGSAGLETRVEPLVRDEGQRLDQRLPLHGMTVSGSRARVVGSRGRVMD
jgi:hypothetical protein